jgi:hypothetical protein
LSAGGFTTPRVQPLLLFSPSLCLFDYHSSFIHASQTNAGRKCTPCARRLKSPATSISAVEQPYSSIFFFTTANSRRYTKEFRITTKSPTTFLSVVESSVQQCHSSGALRAFSFLSLFTHMPRPGDALAVTTQHLRHLRNVSALSLLQQPALI